MLDYKSKCRQGRRTAIRFQRAVGAVIQYRVRVLHFPLRSEFLADSRGEFTVVTDGGTVIADECPVYRENRVVPRSIRLRPFWGGAFFVPKKQI